MIKKLNEDTALKFKTLSPEEKTQRGILGRLYGPVASCVNPTRNNRKYNEALWENLFNSDLIKERFANGGIFGQLCHPDYEEVDMEKVACVMPEPPVKDKNGELISYVDILDTPCGRIAYQLAKYGYKFGISSRGTGDLYTDENGDDAVDPETYNLTAFDLVEIPAVEDARLSFVESLDTKKYYGKTLKQKLTEELNKASDEDKEIMKETLDSLDIKLEEDFDPRGYTKAIQAISDGIENDEDLDALQKYLQDIVGYCNSIANDYNLTIECINESCADKEVEEDGKVDPRVFEENLDEAAPKIVSNKEMLEELISHLKEKYGEEGWQDALFKLLTRVGKDAIFAMADEEHLRENVENENDTVCDDCSDKEVEEDEEVVDDKDLAEELQNMLLRNSELEKDNLSLQEKLSVCNAIETKLNEELSRYKKCSASLSETAKKVRPLKNEIEKLNESLERKDNIITSNKSRFEKLFEDKRDLNSKLKVSNLKLEESISNISELENEINTLTKELENSKKSINENLALITRYKKALKESRDAVITAKAKIYNVNKDDVLSNLNESYKLSDIDSVCKELSKRNYNMSKLPFKITEDVKFKAKASSESIMGRNSCHNTDDEVSDYLLNIVK